MKSHKTLTAAPQATEPTHPPTIDGFRIVVLDRGWVFVGHCDSTSSPGMLRMTKAKNIRRWGTTQGLGELVKGPLKETVLDPVGEMETPLKSVIFTIPCQTEF